MSVCKVCDMQEIPCRLTLLGLAFFKVGYYYQRGVAYVFVFADYPKPYETQDTTEQLRVKGFAGTFRSVAQSANVYVCIFLMCITTVALAPHRKKPHLLVSDVSLCLRVSGMPWFPGAGREPQPQMAASPAAWARAAYSPGRDDRTTGQAAQQPGESVEGGTDTHL